MTLTVSQVARATGISVRTLHHYDEIGLVRPSGRSAAGYRLYAPADLERLQRVLFYRELSIPLDEIARKTTSAPHSASSTRRSTKPRRASAGVPCSRAMHSGLGQMYTQDSRFQATLDGIREGLAAYACAAFDANASR